MQVSRASHDDEGEWKSCRGRTEGYMIEKSVKPFQKLRLQEIEQNPTSVTAAEFNVPLSMEVDKTSTQCICSNKTETVVCNMRLTTDKGKVNVNKTASTESRNSNKAQAVMHNFRLITDKGKIENAAADTNIHLKRKRGRPKKSATTLIAKNAVKEPTKKKGKSLYGAKASSCKTKHQTDVQHTELDALTLANEMRVNDPYRKITIKTSGNDKEEEIAKQASPLEIIQQVIDYKKSCKCNCLDELNMKDIASHRIEITLLDRQSRDFFIMGLLRCGAVTFKETRRHHDRVRNRFSYRLMNTRICHCCFLMVNNIGGKYLKNLKKHFAEHGVKSRIHGNHGRKPYHAISNTDIAGAVEFVSSYSWSTCIQTPKNPKAKRVIRLPASDSVTSVHKKYKEYNSQNKQRAMALTSFRKVWSRHLPHIKLTSKDPVSMAKTQTVSVSLQEPVCENGSAAVHTTLKSIPNSRPENMNTASTSESSEFKLAVPTKPPSQISDFGTGDISRSSVLHFTMYLNENENQDAVQYSYLFPSATGPVTNQIQTGMSSGATLTTLNSKSIQPPLASQNLIQHPSSAENSSIIQLSVDDAFHSSNIQGERHLLPLSSNTGFNANPSQLHIQQFCEKSPVSVYTQSNSDLTHPDPNGSQQTVGTSSTNLTQQIHIYQQ